MKTSALACHDEQRRHQARRRGYNGLDYLEVSDPESGSGSVRLIVYFLGPAPAGLSAANVQITGGVRIRDLEVIDVTICEQHDPEMDNCMIVTLDRQGDFSTYRLCLVDLPEDSRFDPRYRCLDFTFRAGCPTDVDCRATPLCPPEPGPEPAISYLAKDYASFRRLILDRLALLMPDWTERHVPDVGITLVELLAYVGDYLSYFQDAVATEAYLETARRRISVRRHARLVDYLMHEGCNARAWVHVNTSTDVTLPASQLSILTNVPDVPELVDRVLRWDDLGDVPRGHYEVFEPLLEDPEADLRLYAAHNEIRIYTWGDRECCLPRGATSATLVDGVLPADDSEDPEQYDTEQYDSEKAAESPDARTRERALHLAPGDTLIFEEITGPGTGADADADPTHRHPVRLTSVEPGFDELYGQPVLEIAWAEDDALPFPLCLSAVGPAPECAHLQDVSVARGNVILVDHGRRHQIDREELGCVPLDRVDRTCDVCRADEVVRRPARYRPTLARAPLTFSEPPLTAEAPAAAALRQDPRRALPWIRLSSRPDPTCDPGVEETGYRPWTARRDLLASGRHDRHYVVEMDDRRRAHLRFGDGELGRQVSPGARFEGTYRTGNGVAGNVGADTLVLAVTNDLLDGLTLRPRNPLAARGGTEPEPKSDVKLFAPHVFRTVRERAVTPPDYAWFAAQGPDVQGAAAEARWNGSWFEIRVAIDPAGRIPADPRTLQRIETDLQRFRRIGHDLAVRAAGYVPVDIELDVCVEPGFVRAHVREALRARFGTRRLPDGTSGFFHPDALTFGEGIALSRVVSAAQAVSGVESVAVSRLQRMFEPPAGEVEEGLLAIGPLEIARLDSDPNFVENGRIHFELRGGR